MYLGLEHSWKYFAKGEGIRDTAILIHGSVFGDLPSWPKHRKDIARSFRMSEDEVDRLVKAYRESGFAASVDTHTYAMFSNVDRQLNTKTAGGILMDKPWQYFNNIRKVARTVGFDAGEKFQLMGAFLAVRNKWIKENPRKAHLWDKPKYIEEIWGQTRAVSFNMDKTGIMQFQKGALGAAFQFMSHATKSTQVLIPDTKYIGKLANKAFTNKEKARIAASQMMLYGLGGFGIHEMFEAAVGEAGIEVPPELMSYAQEGITGTLMNFLFSLADNEFATQTDLEFSSTAAPFSGIGGRSQIIGMGNPVGFLIDSILLSDKSTLETFGGPGKALFDKGKDWLDFTGAVIGLAPTTEGAAIDFALAAEDFVRQFAPIYGNFIRGRLMDTYDRHISTTGRFGVQVSEGESLAMQMFGTQSRRQRQVSEGLIELRGLLGHPQEDGLRKELDDTAATYYKYLMRKLQLSNPEVTDTREVLKSIITHAQVMQEILAPDEHRYLFNRVRDLALNDVSKDGTEIQLTKAIMGLFKAEVPNVYSEDFMNKVRNWTPFEGQEQLIQIIEEMK